MCGIFASFSPERLKELHKLNNYRGALSYSICSFKPFNVNIKHSPIIPAVLYSNAGDLSDKLVDGLHTSVGDYMVAHVQAPTTQADNRHPAAVAGRMLWHNGIIKQKYLGADTWDTQWLLRNIIDHDWDFLSQVDGTFACVMYGDDSLYVFRNEISPMFVDDNLNLSSTKFHGSRDLPPNVVYELMLQDRTLSEIHTFKTKHNPYFFGS